MNRIRGFGAAAAGVTCPYIEPSAHEHLNSQVTILHSAAAEAGLEPLQPVNLDCAAFQIDVQPQVCVLSWLLKWGGGGISIRS